MIAHQSRQKPLHILFLSQREESPYAHGASTYIHALIEALVNTQDYVVEWALRNGDNNDLRAWMEARGCRYHRAPRLRYIYFTGGRNLLREMADHLPLLLRTRPDVVHLSLTTPFCYLGAVMAGLLLGRRVAITQHTSYPELHAEGRLRQTLHLATALGARWICVSETSRTYFLQGTGLPPESVKRIYNGIVPQRYAFTSEERQTARRTVRLELGLPEDTLLALTVAVVYGYKNPELLLQTAANVSSCHPEVAFVWVGDGDLLAAMRAEVSRAGLSQRVFFIGHRTDVRRWLAASDLFILPSRLENCSYALLEAMAAGLPCIATDVGGNRELIRAGQDGLIVPSEDSSALAAAIKELGDLPVRRQAMGANAQERAQEFHLQKSIERTIELYRA